DTGVLVLKLDNGYNIGVEFSDGVELEKLAGHEEGGAETPRIPEPDPEKPDIAILHTGGTIASKVSYEEGGVRPAFEPEELLELYPELFDEANVESEVIAQMLSEDMEPEHWQQIAEVVAEHRDKDGVIIGHGTDTMQYTASALSFMLENIDVPVVLVGAQRSSDRPSSDAALNLLSAVEFVKEGTPGVFVCMHSDTGDTTASIHRGTRVRKMHTSRRDAFRSIDTGPVAEVDPEAGEVDFNDGVEDPEGEFELHTELDREVGLLKSRPGLEPEDLERQEENEGLVIEGTGLGHLPVDSFDEHTPHHEDILEVLGEIAEESLVVMASQCINGRVNMNVYEAGVKIQDAGVVSAENMTPETAYVKLMWALGQADSTEEAEELFRTNVAGEILEREEKDGFGH
ncbi:MAG: Glu-tRNA(Gln) amidotransferase subunit GatD, partial [Candidatus Nanohaloarchaea archaeon]|nr:Glu-tRNA(Gln) amidotransferase subunit GatD [Candidatus Nanohaloarchaea archaeon]